MHLSSSGPGSLASRLSWAAAFVVIAGLFAVEAAFSLPDGSSLRRLAALYWILCSCAVILSTWAYAFAPFFSRGFWRERGLAWYLVAFLLPPSLILVDAGGIRFTGIDQEGAQQLAVGMKYLTHSPDLGVYSIGYFKYIARSYALNSLPTYFFGPSLLALRLGNSFLYIGAYLFFLPALAAYLRHRKAPEPLLFTAYAGMMISLGGYALLNARKFEQTVMPLGITLLLLGALMLLLARPTPLRWVWATWAIGMLAYAYTPALATWVLGMAVLGHLIWKGRRMFLVVTATYGMAALLGALFVTAYGTRLDRKFKVAVPHSVLSDKMWYDLRGLRVLVSADFSLIPPPLALAIIAAVCIAWRQRERRFWLVLAWSACTAVASLTFIGSNLSFPAFAMHRCLILIPPLALGVVLILSRHLSESAANPQLGRAVVALMCISMGYMVFTSVSVPFTSRTFMAMNVVSDDDELLKDVIDLARSGNSPPRRLYLLPPLVASDIDRSIEYFDPGAIVVRAPPPHGEKMPGAYIFSYRTDKVEGRSFDEIVPSRHPRPFLKYEKE